MKIIIQVTECDEDSGVVNSTTIKTYDGIYGYELRKVFERLIDEYIDSDDRWLV